MISKNAFIINKEINEQNIIYYGESDFLIAEDLLSENEMSEINQEAIEIFRGKRGDIEGIVKSNDNTSDFEILKKYIAIHFPHKISSKIMQYMLHPLIADILTKIVSPNIKCMQSMLFVKGPGKPGQSWHQDEYYIPTRDRSLTGVWIAVDNAEIENGCLWVIPGSHKNMAIKRRLPYTGDQYGDVDLCELNPYSEKDAIAVEVKKGSVVFFNGYLFHSSLRNKTKDRFRTSLVSHYMSAESLLPWDWDGRLELKDDMRDIIMVAGEDPYAHKGIKDLTYPFLRPETVEIIKES